MLQYWDQRLIKVALDVFLGRFVFWCLFLVKKFCHISFEVHIDSIHSIYALFIPRCLVLEERSKLGRQSVIFGPVLDKVSHHELFVEDKDWEVKLFPIVKSDMLLDNFWELMNLLTQFDTSFSNYTIDGHHAVLLRLVDQLNFLDSFDLFGKLLIALSAHLSQLLAVGTLKRCISDEFRGFVPLF